MTANLSRWLKHNHPEEERYWDGYARIISRLQLKSWTGQKYAVDHIVPIVEGGSFLHTNLCVMRADWNRKKGKSRWPRQVEEFLLWQNPESDRRGHLAAYLKRSQKKESE